MKRIVILIIVLLTATPLFAVDFARFSLASEKSASGAG